MFFLRSSRTDVSRFRKSPLPLHPHPIIHITSSTSLDPHPIIHILASGNKLLYYYLKDKQVVGFGVFFYLLRQDF